MKQLPVALLSTVCLAACGPSPKPAKQAAASAAPESAAGSEYHPVSEFYSHECAYRVAFPPGTVLRMDDNLYGESLGASFRIAVPGGTLEGEVEGTVRGTPMFDDRSTIAQRCQNSIGDLELYRDRPAPPSPGTPFVLAYKAIQQDWYVFSGTRGSDIFYEKGLQYENSARLRLSYPASEKNAFDPIVSLIAGSFGEYRVVTAKAGIMTGEDGEPGLLFLQDVPGDDPETLTVCAVDPKDRIQFAAVEEGKTITVAGYPQLVNVRAKTEQLPAVNHRRLTHCVPRQGM